MRHNYFSHQLEISLMHHASSSNRHRNRILAAQQIADKHFNAHAATIPAPENRVNPDAQASTVHQ
jgi:hypothetical protein